MLAGAPPPSAPGPQQLQDSHAALFAEERFPSATTCAACHGDIYREWSVSPHAYAQLSPVFNAMQAKIGKLTNGTNGDFCIRCHTPVGMNLGEPTFQSNLDRHPTSQEGVTCVVCHRQNQAHGKISGRLPLVEGGLHEPVFGPSGNDGLAEAIGRGDLHLQPDPERPGRAVHAEARPFFELSRPGLCGSCHDVNFPDGFRLEEAFSEFKHSPAAGQGTTCQDCHMGKEPGVPSGYAEGPAARVGDQPTRRRKRTNHMFAGPDYSIVHPGIFPHNPEARKLATLREWLSFDYEAGWGTDAFEENVPEGTRFPPRWTEADDRYDAVDILRDNLELLDEITGQRLALLRNGYRLGELVVDQAGPQGLAFRVALHNGTDGHNVPTGFDAERLVWLEVTVTDAAGKPVFRSGDLDPNGDVRDSHSVYVHNDDLPEDRQLFSLQSRFLVRMVRGGEREQVLAIPYSPSPLVFLRPSTHSSILTGRPADARKHRRTIPPRGTKWASYVVRREALEGTTGPYLATIRLKAAMVPVNLVHEVADVGFDYGMTERQVADAVVAGHLTLRERTVNLSAGGAEAELPPAPVGVPADSPGDGGEQEQHSGSRLSDEYLPLQLDSFPKRPKPLLELGPRFLETGRIGPGFTVPGGAVWRPSFLVFGTLRSGVGRFDDGTGATAEWANRLDLFGNLALTGSERVVFGLRPLDRTGANGRPRFSGYTAPDGFQHQAYLDWDAVTQLFFEGDLGELLPALDPDDRRGLDLGLSIGRQPISFQDGLLVDDFIDAAGFTRNSVRPGGVSNLRFTGLYGWNQIHRPGEGRPHAGEIPGSGARLLGAFTEVDWRVLTGALDVIYLRGGRAGSPVEDVNDGLHAGASIAGRPGSGAVYAALRFLASVPFGSEPSGAGRADPGTRSNRGALFFSEVSWTPHRSDNFFYASGFYAAGEYRPAALDPRIPGPLARVGILFASPDLGGAPGALSPRSENVAGGAIGHQMFFAGQRRQLLVEGGARYSTAGCGGDSTACEPHALAGGLRYQVAVGRRGVLVFDVFAARDLLRRALEGAGGGFRLGGRAEVQIRF